MQIGGFIKSSLIDYPGKTAAVIFTRGCNFRCPFCHNPDLVLFPAGAAECSEKDIFELLSRRKHLLDGVVVSGGEPTLQPDLPSFLSKIKKARYLIKLDTNGSRPEILDLLIREELVDFIAMDVKSSWQNYSAACGGTCDIKAVKRSLDLIKASGIANEFRVTAVKPLHSQQDLIEIAELTGKNFVIQKFVKGRTLDPHFSTRAGPFTQEEMEMVKNTLEKKGLNCIIR